jgi:hypothetical protein
MATEVYPPKRFVGMKRDMDLIRDILLRVEEDKTLTGSRFKTFSSADFAGHSDEEVTYHVDLLFEAGLIDGSPNMTPLPAISKLTWQGHEFIGATKDPQIWASVKERLKGLPDVALSLIGEIGKAELKKHLGLP